MLYRYLTALDKERYPSSVISLLKPGAVGPRIDSVSVRHIALGMRVSRVTPMDIIRLTRAVRSLNPALLHGWMYHGNLAASIAGLVARGRPPVIWGVHHSLSDLSLEKPSTRWVIRLSARLSRRTAAIIYCSRAAADDHERVGYSALRRVIIPNGIDCNEFQPSANARSQLIELLGIPESRIVIGNVARFHPMKDQANLVHAIAMLRAKGHDVHGLVIGDGHDEEGPVRRTARELGIADRITTLGARGDISRLMPGLDLYALSSAWGEAFPLAVTEAMACGVPAVVTDVGDCSWLVGDTGTVVPPRDAQALASAIATVIDLGPDGRRQLGTRARSRVVENFSLKQYVAKHRDVYTAALESSRSSPVPA